jgi:hypothetical protein
VFVNDGEEFIERFAREVPGFMELYSIHLENEGELLGHVFFGVDVVKATVASYLQDPEEESDWRATLAYLEKEFERHVVAIDRIIVTSFLWQLPYKGQPGAEIACHLGPQMKARLAELRPDAAIRQCEAPG